MYTLLNDNVVRVSVVGGKGSLATLTFYEQSSIQNVMDGIGSTIELYDDVEMTSLVAVYNQVEIERATVDLKKNTVSLLISSSRLTDLETEKLKEDVEAQKASSDLSDGAIAELAELIATAMDELAGIHEQIASLDDRVTALEQGGAE